MAVGHQFRYECQIRNLDHEIMAYILLLFGAGRGLGLEADDVFMAAASLLIPAFTGTTFLSLVLSPGTSSLSPSFVPAGGERPSGATAGDDALDDFSIAF